MMKNSRAARSTATMAALGFCGALLAISLAACGSGSGLASPPLSPSSTPKTSGTSNPSVTSSASPAVTTSPSATQCPSSALRVTIGTNEGSAAAGTSYVPVDFTNTSSQSCVLYGYPGVSFVTGPGGSQIGNAASRVTTFGPVTVSLAKGASAHAWLGVADAGNFPVSICHPVTAHWLKIFPPDQFTALYTGYTTQACSAKITNGATPLTIFTIRSGLGVAGHVP
jgi:hypothetical protein